MSEQITEQKILNALRSVALPTADNSSPSSNIADAGCVTGIVIKTGNVGFTIEIDPALSGQADALRKQAEAAIDALDGVLSVSVVMTAHKPQGQQQTSQPAQKAPTEQKMNQPARHIIAVASGKGGVGKSTTSINLALALAESGQRVGLLDADIYGPSVPRLVGLNQKPQTKNNKLVPIDAWGLQAMSIGFLLEEDAPTIWRGPMVMSALQQMIGDVAWDGLDILVVDMPPGTGDAPLTLAQRVDLAGAVIVSTPQDLALIDARKGLNMFRRVDVNVFGIVENMSYFICPDCGSRSEIFGSGGAETEADKLGLPFLGRIPLDMQIRKTSDAGTPIMATQPDSPHAQSYRDIAGRILSQIS